MHHLSSLALLPFVHMHNESGLHTHMAYTPFIQADINMHHFSWAPQRCKPSFLICVFTRMSMTAYKGLFRALAVDRSNAWAGLEGNKTYTYTRVMTFCLYMTCLGK